MCVRLFLLTILITGIIPFSVTESTSVDEPHWVLFNPRTDALPADAIVGGYEDETLYVTRAPHEGSLTPGKYFPSIQKAIIPWGSLTYVKDVTEILCGQKYQWIPTNIKNMPNEVVYGGRSEYNNEPLYICRAQHYEHFIVGKVQKSTGVCYVPYLKQEVLKNIFEVLTVSQKFTESTSVAEPHWVPFNPKTDALPVDAIVGGYEEETLYIGRNLNKYGYMVPGMYVASTRQFTIPYFEKTYIRNITEILCGYNYKWVIPSADAIPAGAVVGGKSDLDNETMYIGRTYYNNQIFPGKIKPSSKKIFIPYKGREAWSTHFEVLVAISMSPNTTRITYAVTEDQGSSTAIVVMVVVIIIVLSIAVVVYKMKMKYCYKQGRSDSCNGSIQNNADITTPPKRDEEAHNPYQPMHDHIYYNSSLSQNYYAHDSSDNQYDYPVLNRRAQCPLPQTDASQNMYDYACPFG